MKVFNKRIARIVWIMVFFNHQVEDACHAASAFGDSLLLPDRYFLTVPALEKLKALNDSGSVRMEIVTKAKKSCTAYQKPGPCKPGRGRPPEKGPLST